MNAESFQANHIPFEDLSAYVFSSAQGYNMLATAARINHHLMSCAQCKEQYNALMALKDETDRAASVETVDESIKTRIFAFLYSVENNKTIKMIARECLGFEKWLSFSIKNLRELSQTESPFFQYPRMVTASKSHDGGRPKQNETVIKSSLYDADKNRVSIGLDGTLSLYFNEEDHPIGKRVIILPDEKDESPQMLELTRYDDSISCVRFEGLKPGQYTIAVEV